MKILNVIKSKCVKCKSCVKVCPSQLFLIKNNKNDISINFHDPNKFCIGCGHCVAVCNYNAIDYKSLQNHIKIEKDGFIDYSSVINLFKGQRSIRNYSSKEVSKEDISKILDIMRYAPTGSNRQSCEYIVINDEEIKDRLKYFTIKNLDLLFTTCRRESPRL
jgi:ferredoxin